MTWSALNQAELESEHSAPIYFIFLDFAIEPFYACSGVRTYTWGGEDWLGLGEISGISDIANATDIAARPITLTMTGVDSYITEPVLSRTNYKNQSAVIYQGFLDSDGDLVDDPEIIWRGRMDVGSMAWDETYMAQMICEPLTSRLLRPNLSRYSDQDHQVRYPGDKFYEFLAQMEQKDVTWGGRRISPSTGGGETGRGPGGPARRIF